jgi:hypothetical protein
MTKKKEVILKDEKPAEVAEEVAEVVAEVEEVDEEEEEDDNIEATPPVKTARKKKVNGTHVIEPYGKCTKPKRVATEAQLANFAKGREALRIKRERINAEKARLLEEEKKNTEERIVKKAVSIQKKKLKKEKVIEEVSDDDDDVEEIKKTVSKRKVVEKTVYMPPQVPRFSFV